MKTKISKRARAVPETMSAHNVPLLPLLLYGSASFLALDMHHPAFLGLIFPMKRPAFTDFCFSCQDARAGVWICDFRKVIRDIVALWEVWLSRYDFAVLRLVNKKFLEHVGGRMLNQTVELKYLGRANALPCSTRKVPAAFPLDGLTFGKWIEAVDLRSLHSPKQTLKKTLPCIPNVKHLAIRVENNTWLNTIASAKLMALEMLIV